MASAYEGFDHEPGSPDATVPVVAIDNVQVEPWEMREWFSQYLDAVNRHNPDLIRSFLDPQVKRAHRPRGADAWLTESAELFRAFPDWQWRRIHLLVEDDRLAVQLRGSGSQVGSFRGITPTRRHVSVAEFALYRVAHGRVVEFSGSPYAVEILDQLR